jgi:hypothetical protein
VREKNREREREREEEEEEEGEEPNSKVSRILKKENHIHSFFS